MGLRSQVVTLNVVYDDCVRGRTVAPEHWSWDWILDHDPRFVLAVEVLAAGPVKTHRNEEDA